MSVPDIALAEQKKYEKKRPALRNQKQDAAFLVHFVRRAWTKGLDSGVYLAKLHEQ